MRKTYKLMPVYALLSLGAVFMVFPFVWMVLTSLKTGADVYSFSMIPNPATTQNYSFVFTRTDFVRWFLNSIFVAVMVVSSVLMFDTLVGYTLCKMQFRGKQLVFILIMSTLMVPTEMLIIPWYLMSAQLKWLNTYWSIMFPGLITAFGIFMMRQFFEGVPDELLEAARIDGSMSWASMPGSLSLWSCLPCPPWLSLPSWATGTPSCGL